MCLLGLGAEDAEQAGAVSLCVTSAVTLLPHGSSSTTGQVPACPGMGGACVDPHVLHGPVYFLSVFLALGTPHPSCARQFCALP